MKLLENKSKFLLKPCSDKTYSNEDLFEYYT